MPRPLVIIHGWSDTSKSFQDLEDVLSERLGIPPTVIRLVDYVSLVDDVTLADISEAMNAAWRDKKLPRTTRSVDVIVHSTGGLVIREWQHRYFSVETGQQSPIHHLVMLAPANFGSPLAHKGRSFVGRVLKGWGQKPLQTGREILRSLELASPYQWGLAMKERFGAADPYGPGKVLCTVMIGNRGYSGIQAAANEPGSDGTVRVSSANMNVTYIQADYSKDPKAPTYSRKEAENTAFLVLDGENHSTIFSPKEMANAGTLDYIVRALQVTDAHFDSWCAELAQASEATREAGEGDTYTHGFQNTVFRVRDDHGAHIDDYFLEFYVDDKDKSWIEERFHRDAIRTVHTNRDDSAYRSVLVDTNVLFNSLDKPFEKLQISLSAQPDFSSNQYVGYETFTDKDIGSIQLAGQELREFFEPDRTVLCDVVIKRKQSSKVFGLKMRKGQ